MRYSQIDWIALATLALTSSFLLLTQLDSPYLWQDEAQTAVISETILTHGIPHGTDGRNFFSQEQGIEYADGPVWKWHTWLSFYTVAGAFLVLGKSTLAARLPFALFGIATILLCYVAGRSFWRDRTAALAGAGFLALSVPYLVLSRQCRWYGIAAFFSLLALFAYTRIDREERRYSALLFGAATLLFHTHYLYAATLLLTLLTHSFLLERAKLVRVVVVAGAVTLVNSPWILWFSSIPYGERYAGTPFDLSLELVLALRFAQDFFVYFLSPLFLVTALGIAGARLRRGERALAIAPETRRHASLLALNCVITIGLLALLAPGAFFRYLTPLAPPAFLLGGVVVGALAARSAAAATAIAAIWLSLGSLWDFTQEITSEFDGPIEGIVRFLDKRAAPGDTVAISYGDMPLKFYTDLRIIGGLTGEDLAEAADADWIILRRSAFTDVDRRVKAELKAHLDAGDYTDYRIRFPDTAFENREDPRFHRFRTAPESYPRVVISGKR